MSLVTSVITGGGIVGVAVRIGVQVGVGECMYTPECEKRGADGSIFAARLLWSKPNKMVKK